MFSLLFFPYSECEEGWEAAVVDAALEKLGDISHVVHVFVDSESQEGCVYLKCSSLEAAGRARLALHGWWFDGGFPKLCLCLGLLFCVFECRTVVVVCFVFISWPVVIM